MTARLSGHCMMPTYSLLNEEDAQEVAESFFGAMSARKKDSAEMGYRFPQISVDDPAILSLRQELGMDADEIDGRVVKFLRRSLRAGIAPFYRVVVNSSIAASMNIMISDAEGRSIPGGVWSMDYRVVE